MITHKDLFESSLKNTLLKREEYCRLNNIVDESRMRKSQDVESRVFSNEEINAIIREMKPSLINDCGVTVWSKGRDFTDEVFFIVDDSSFGWETFKKHGFVATGYRLPMSVPARLGFEKGRIDTPEELVKIFYSKATRHITNNDELLEYLNAVEQ